jgi:hypothetical protein
MERKTPIASATAAHRQRRIVRMTALLCKPLCTGRIGDRPTTREAFSPHPSFLA